MSWCFDCWILNKGIDLHLILIKVFKEKHIIHHLRGLWFISHWQKWAHTQIIKLRLHSSEQMNGVELVCLFFIVCLSFKMLPLMQVQTVKLSVSKVWRQRFTDMIRKFKKGKKKWEDSITDWTDGKICVKITESVWSKQSGYNVWRNTKMCGEIQTHI